MSGSHGARALLTVLRATPKRLAMADCEEPELCISNISATMSSVTTR